MVALETHTVLFSCRERERGNEDRVKEREVMVGGGGVVEGEAKKRKRNECRLAGRRGLGYFLSAPLSLPLSLSRPLFLSLSFCFLVPFLSSLCLLKEKAGEEGANVRESERECVERGDGMDQTHSFF